MSPEAVRLLVSLVDDGPRLDMAPGTPALIAQTELTVLDLVESIDGANGRTLLRATFAGKRLRAEWRDAAEKLMHDKGL